MCVSRPLRCGAEASQAGITTATVGIITAFLMTRDSVRVRQSASSFAFSLFRFFALSPSRPLTLLGLYTPSHGRFHDFT